jgi:NAD(P)-dependent dehydrogenase (short-subunit alcohol dehydrogenase family)
MSGRLAGKVAIITGAASGIGAATAWRFAREGAYVLAVDRSDFPAHSEAQAPGEAANAIRTLKVDVQAETEVEKMVQTALDSWGRLDILVNNAGVATGANILNMTTEEFDRVIGINLKGPMLGCKYAIKAMLQTGGGAIVNVASISSTSGIPGQAIYAPSKAGVLQLTRQLAVEFSSSGIRVNAVSPGTIETPMIDAMVQDPARRPKYDWLKARHPIGRFGKAGEVASAILFLASDEASFITGANLAVDGGFTAQ